MYVNLLWVGKCQSLHSVEKLVKIYQKKTNFTLLARGFIRVYATESFIAPDISNKLFAFSDASTVKIVVNGRNGWYKIQAEHVQKIIFDATESAWCSFKRNSLKIGLNEHIFWGVTHATKNPLIISE